MSEQGKPQNLFDFQKYAREKLDPVTYSYFASGAKDEITIHENQNAFRQISLYPRVLTKNRKRNYKTTLLGIDLKSPIIIAPMGFMRLAHQQGELAVAKAAKKHKIMMSVSTVSTVSLKKIAKVNKNLIFQLYMYNKKSTRELVKRATDANYKAIMITVDLPLLAKRDNYKRHGQIRDIDLPNLRWTNHFKKWSKKYKDDSVRNYIETHRKKNLAWDGWECIEEVASMTCLPIIVKGIMTPQDAVLAVKHGAKGIVVSNHGGRQLDTAQATIKALPEIAKVIGSDTAIIIDGGIRRGTDVLKALALGANAVMVGQPILWGLAYDGKDGVDKVLKILHEELDEAMALCGCNSISDIDDSLIFNQKL